MANTQISVCPLPTPSILPANYKLVLAKKEYEQESTNVCLGRTMAKIFINT